MPRASGAPGPRALRGETRPLGYRHIGIYVFRTASLLRFTELPQTPLEISEGLEQLRALEHGMVVQVVEIVCNLLWVLTFRKT